jgi:Na+/proline symporter
MAIGWVIALCILAFIIGALAVGIFQALEPALEAKLDAEEMGLLTCIQKAIHVAWSAIFGKKKAASTTAAPATPKS